MKRTKMTKNERIQLGILIAITATMIVTLFSVILTGVSIRQQGEFNRNSLRPWVCVKPEEMIGIETDSSNLVFVIYLENIGYSPAFKIKESGAFLFSPEYPESIIAGKLHQKREPFLFPGQKGFYSFTDINFGLPSYIDITNDSTFLSGLTDIIKDKTIYLHTYVEYIDADLNKYCFRNTYNGIFKGLVGKELKLGWVSSYASEECITDR